MLINSLLIKNLNVPTYQLGRFFWNGFEYLEVPLLHAAIDHFRTIEIMQLIFRRRSHRERHLLRD